MFQAHQRPRRPTRALIKEIIYFLYNERKREREKERKREKEREREKERDRETERDLCW